MGCFQSKHGTMQKINFRNSTIPTLTEDQRKLIKDCWQELKENAEKVGVITFMNLFETHPEVKNSFLPFQNLKKEDMEHSEILRSHALRVLATVDKFVSRIESAEKSQELMMELGRRHKTYNAKSEYIDMVGPQFVCAIKQQAEEKWNDELEQAWLKLFQIMSHHMTKGLKKMRKTK